MSAEDTPRLVVGSLEAMTSEFSAGLSILQFLGVQDADSGREYGNIQEASQEVMRNALQHYVDMCHERGFREEFRGDVPGEYIEALLRRFQERDLDVWGRPLEDDSDDSLGINSDVQGETDYQDDSDYAPSDGEVSGEEEEASVAPARESDAEIEEESGHSPPQRSRGSRENRGYSSGGSFESAASSGNSSLSGDSSSPPYLSDFLVRNRPHSPPPPPPPRGRRASSSREVHPVEMVDPEWDLRRLNREEFDLVAKVMKKANKRREKERKSRERRGASTNLVSARGSSSSSSKRRSCKGSSRSSSSSSLSSGISSFRCVSQLRTTPKMSRKMKTASSKSSHKLALDPSIKAMNIRSSRAERAAFALSMESSVTGDLFPLTWIKNWGTDVWNTISDCFGNAGELAGTLADTFVLGSNAHTPLLDTAESYSDYVDLYEETVANFDKHNQTLVRKLQEEVYLRSGGLTVLSEAVVRKVPIYQAVELYQKLFHETFSAMTRLYRTLGEGDEGFLVLKKILSKVKEMRRGVSRAGKSCRSYDKEVVKHVRRLNVTNSFFRGIISSGGEIATEGGDVPAFLKRLIVEARSAEMARRVSASISGGGGAEGGGAKPSTQGSTKSQKHDDFRTLLKGFHDEGADFYETEKETPTKLSASGSAGRGCFICGSSTHYHFDCKALPERGQRKQFVAKLVKNLGTPANKAVLKKLNFTKKRASDAIRTAIQ